MSILVDQFIRENKDRPERGFGPHGEYMAKPLNYEKPYRSLRQRLSDAWRVLRGKSIAIHYMEDEVLKTRAQVARVKKALKGSDAV